jgi:hypothetical protein
MTGGRTFIRLIGHYVDHGFDELNPGEQLAGFNAVADTYGPSHLPGRVSAALNASDGPDHISLNHVTAIVSSKTQQCASLVPI